MLVSTNMQGAIYVVAPLIDQKQAVDIFTRPVSHHSLKTTTIVPIKFSQCQSGDFFSQFFANFILGISSGDPTFQRSQ